MKFHKEGYPTLVLILALDAAILGIAHYFFSQYPVVLILSYLLAGFLLIAITQFFRSPQRTVKTDDNQILSPCDGKVVVIEETQESEYLKEKRRQISIFMSPVNVHNNRYPVGGRITYYKYHPGKYLVAWHPKSSTENERTTIVLEDQNKRSILFRQIAGAVARRIVFYGKAKEVVKQGEECGFIKFGSRVDLLIPLDAKVSVSLNDKVVGGKSVIATYF